MTMLARVQAKRIDGLEGAPQFLVSDSCYPQTLDVLRSRAEPLGIEIILVPNELLDQAEFGDRVFGALVQSPDSAGGCATCAPSSRAPRRRACWSRSATDLLSLALLTPPGEMGADVVYGNSQRFGVPLGYGGPHAAFFATLDKHVRQAPGRIIGVSIDVHGNTAYRMALQTREQHIRREKATSNICTAQALLANIAGLYAVYHGPKGIKAIATRVHAYAKLLTRALEGMGFRQLNDHYFDTPRFDVPGGVQAVGQILKAAQDAGINLGYRMDNTIHVALDETVDEADILALLVVFGAGATKKSVAFDKSTAGLEPAFPAALARTTPYLTHPVFNTHHSETQMMRYIRGLERKDIGLDTSMIPLGSCTMKLNAASEMLPITWPEFGKLHPFAPVDQAAGYQAIFTELERMLCEITGFAAVSLQPNSGAQGEYAGLMVIRQYHKDRGDTHRDVVLIPASAHGTNPASAAMVGMNVVVVASTKDGNIDVADLKAKADAHKDRLGGADGDVSVDPRRVRGEHPGHLRDRARARRPGVHGRREHERAGRPDQPRGDWRRCLPHQPAQDVQHPARRRRSRHGTDRRRGAPRAVSAGASDGGDRRRQGDSCAVGGALGQREHPVDLVRLHEDAGPRRHDRRHPLRHPERELSQVAGSSRISRCSTPGPTAASRTR